MSMFEEANSKQEAEDCESDVIGSLSLVDTSAKRRSLAEWLNSLFPSLYIPMEVSDEELRVLLFDGTVLCGIVNGKDPNSLEQYQRGVFMSSEQSREKVRRFCSAVEGMGLPRFTVDDLENGSISAVVDCLLSLRNHFNSKLDEGDVHGTANCGNQTRKKWFTSKDYRGVMDASQGNLIRSGKKFRLGEDETKKNYSESMYHRILHNPVLSEQTASLRKFHEVLQLKQGRYSDIPPAKISEIIKSNGLDNAPAQSLLSVIYGILDESMDRKNGEIPLRAASLIRKVVQEIGRRLTTQTQHIRNQNDILKAREEKYQSRIRVLESLAYGTNEEIQVQKTAVEEGKKEEEQQALKLMKEKENNDRTNLELKQELEAKNNTYDYHYRHLDVEAKQNEARLEKRKNDAESLLSESSKRLYELEALSKLKLHDRTKKEHVFQKFLSFQLQSLKGLRTSSESIKVEVINSQREWREELNSLGFRLKVLVDAAQSYHTVLAENRKLYNEVQELKGNIRIFCRLRPFLPSQIVKSATVDYTGDNGELVLVNPSKQGEDGRRVFKFNKVFGQTANQGGQAKTLMFVQVNLDAESYTETLSTLKFAERVSGVELGAARSNKVGKNVKDLIEQVEVFHLKQRSHSFESRVLTPRKSFHM